MTCSAGSGSISRTRNEPFADKQPRFVDGVSGCDEDGVLIGLGVRVGGGIARSLQTTEQPCASVVVAELGDHKEVGVVTEESGREGFSGSGSAMASIESRYPGGDDGLSYHLA